MAATTPAANPLDQPIVPHPTDPNYVPDFVHHENQNNLAIGVLTTCAAISTICVFLRFYGRVMLLRKVQAEEVMVLCAYGAYWGGQYANYRMIEAPGYMTHAWDLPLRALEPTKYYVMVFGICYSFVLPLLKVSIMVEWCRMFVPRGNRTKSAFWWGCVVISFVQITVGIATVIALALECIPHYAIFDLSVPESDKKCFKLYNLQLSSSIIQLVCDVAIFLLPQHVIWTLKMTWQKRLGVSVIFGLGLLACVSACFRLSVTIENGNSADPTFTIGPLLFWATAEQVCGFFIICIPCIPKILKDSGVLRKMKKAFGMGTTTKPSGRSDYYANGTMPHSKGTTTTSNAYYKLDEDGVPLQNMKGSESTENLNAKQSNAGIVLTTRIEVNTQDNNSVSDGGSHDNVHMNKAAWAR